MYTPISLYHYNHHPPPPPPPPPPTIPILMMTFLSSTYRSTNSTPSKLYSLPPPPTSIPPTIHRQTYPNRTPPLKINPKARFPLSNTSPLRNVRAHISFRKHPNQPTNQPTPPINIYDQITQKSTLPYLTEQTNKPPDNSATSEIP
ncbi:hypothetical protein L873DRAFT_1257291 [Choiromyces venosus 120613-1]|uniref:Uncharacterized protein n=1 Tax=Choiromyces venosus 120613-1 TaxID=1336337 RepID=A0A3N4JD59_9PEZI|nr:hypothetical protein L873DRAFT_1257291 [Choiromyces venosus 120613-1]